MAVREGFEPSIHFRVYTLSRRAPSATRTPHHIFVAKSSLQRGAIGSGADPVKNNFCVLFVRSSRAHFAENCGERQGTCHEWVRKSAVSSWITDGNGDHCRRGERCSPLSAVHHAKSLDANPGFLFNLAVRGVDSLRSPCGPPLAVQNAGVLSNPVEASRPSRRCTMQKAGRESRLSL